MSGSFSEATPFRGDLQAVFDLEHAASTAHPAAVYCFLPGTELRETWAQVGRLLQHRTWDHFAEHLPDSVLGYNGTPVVEGVGAVCLLSPNVYPWVDGTGQEHDARLMRIARLGGPLLATVMQRGPEGVVPAEDVSHDVLKLVNTDVSQPTNSQALRNTMQSAAAARAGLYLVRDRDHRRGIPIRGGWKGIEIAEQADGYPLPRTKLHTL